MIGAGGQCAGVPHCGNGAEGIRTSDGTKVCAGRSGILTRGQSAELPDCRIDVVQGIWTFGKVVHHMRGGGWPRCRK